MSQSDHKRQKKLADKIRRRKERAKEQASRDRRPVTQFIEGRDSYEKEYRRMAVAAMREHKSLLRVIECDDDVFYDMDTNAKLRYFDLARYSEVVFETADDIDFSKDPTTSESGRVNAVRKRSEGTSVTGHTSVIESESQRRTIIFMRRETGTNDTHEVKCALKLAALLHELGHVDDYEQLVNYRGQTINVIDAEAYAHHHACRKLVEGNYRILLGYYLQGIEEMSRSDSEYVRRAAMRLMESPEYAGYQAAVSPHYCAPSASEGRK